MFPLRDTARTRSIPIVNWLLIGANTVIFLMEFLLQARLGSNYLQSFLTTFGMVPAKLSLGRPLSFLTILSSMFLHGSWFHLISNMWILFIFGDNIEDRLGSARYFAFYIISGVIAGLTEGLLLSKSTLPTVGASGAIAGVLGAYLVLFPRSRVLTLIPLFIFPWLVEIPAYVFLGIWFLSQLSSGLLSIGAMGNFGGIAWWAHIGGFLFGIVAGRLLIRRRRPDLDWPQTPSW
jgi:membrane associated rhomboid family serine protease